MTYKHNKTWRLRHPEIRGKGTRRYFRKTAWARNHRVKWNIHHLALAVAHVMPDRELAEIIGRSVAAIQKVRYVYR